jgi:hypothetical protein
MQARRPRQVLRCSGSARLQHRVAHRVYEPAHVPLRSMHLRTNALSVMHAHPCAIMRLALAHQAGEAAGSRSSTWPGPGYPYMVPGWALRLGAAPGAAHPDVLLGPSPLSRERLSFIDLAPGPSALPAASALQNFNPTSSASDLKKQKMVAPPRRPAQTRGLRRRLPGQRQRQTRSSAAQPPPPGMQAESGLPPCVFRSQDQQPTWSSPILSQRRLTQQLTKQWPQFNALRQHYAGTFFEEQRQLNMPQKHKATAPESSSR